MENILPYSMYNALKKLKYNGVYELRLRVNKPCVVNYFNSPYYLSTDGITNQVSRAIICSEEDVNMVVNSASNYSLYAINEQLKNGFITINGGVRIGVVGQVVTENGKVLTVKNFSSLNIRFPHQVKGIANDIINYLLKDDEILNTLIISPAGAGKTTLLRDLVRLISNDYKKNILLIDERNEISSTVDGVMQMDLGDFCDVIVSSTKYDGFINGIRSMGPEIVATDEIGTLDDIKAIEYATCAGVNVLATIHSKNIDELLKKQNIEGIIKNKLFDRYIVLSSKNGKGTVEAIYNENFINIKE